MSNGKAKAQEGNTVPDPCKYDVNFFKPKSAHARADMKMISIMIIIWVIAVFGFQVLLMLTNKATPEPAYKTFQQVWQSVASGTADVEMQKKFSRSVLSVIGKNISVGDADKAILKEALCYSVTSLLGADQKAMLNAYAADYAKSTSDHGAVDQLVIQAINTQTKAIAAAIGLTDSGFDKLMIDLLPSSIVQGDVAVLSDKAKIALPGIMKLFLVHNRSKLTDTKFIGFPFHYWYTAQFLLILFVLLCLVYAILIDKINTKHNFKEI
ncbi:MAG: sodium/substrate symporter small subunit [Sedimentisphaerales bacterium]